MFTVIVSNNRQVISQTPIKKLNKAKGQADNAKKEGYLVEVYDRHGKLVHN
jgi:hypothetical protein